MMFSLSFLKMTFANISPSSVRNKTEAFISVLLPRKLQRGEGVAFTHRRWHGQSVFGPRGDQDSAPPPRSGSFPGHLHFICRTDPCARHTEFVSS